MVGHSLEHGVVHQPRRSFVRGAERDDVGDRTRPVRRQREGGPNQTETKGERRQERSTEGHQDR